MSSNPTQVNNFFGEDKILVTGASGLLGRNVYEYLKSHGLNVVGTYNSHSKEGLIKCDLTDYKQTKDLLEKENIKYVFMFAAIAHGVGILSIRPETLIRENLVMNSNMFELCYYAKVKKVFFCSSSSVYQEANYHIKEEEYDLNKEPSKYYFGNGWMKRYLEKLCEFYNRLGLSIVIMRPGNIYGKYDKSDVNAHFIPAIIQRILGKPDKLIIWGDGTPQKNLIYAEDLARDAVLMMTGYNSISPLIVASDTNATVGEIVNLLVKIADYKGEIVYDPTKPNAIQYRGLDTTKFSNIFGKQKYTSLIDGLTTTYNWIKNDK
jgi:GDP-L-fucose synthase